ncbi:MAG: hypothetical protein R3A48_14405 [Polyangiales bacterium]
MRARILALPLVLAACGGTVVSPTAAPADGSSEASIDDASGVVALDAASDDDVPTLGLDAVAPIEAGVDAVSTARDAVAVDALEARDAPADVVADAGPRCEVTELGSALGEGVASGSTASSRNLFRGGCGGEAGPEVALRWTAPRAGTFTFTTAGSDFDTLLYLRSECGGRDRACNDDVVSGVVRSSTATLELAAGEPLLIFIDGWEDSAGNYVLNIAEGGPVRCAPRSTRSCYGGPTGTVNVGRCAAVTQTCLSQGVWPDLCRGDVRPSDAEVCANNVDDDCDGMIDEGCGGVGTRALAGTVVYQRRVPNAQRSDWVNGDDAPAPGFAVYSFRGDQMIDATVTSVEAMREGTYSLRVAAAPTPQDRVVVAALQRDARGVITYALANPALPSGTYAPHSGADASRVWSWTWPVDAIPSDGTLRIRQAQSSGAAVTFEHLGRAVRAAEARYGRRGYSLLAWQGDDVSWTCGACFSVTPTQRFGQGFSSQISMFGDNADGGYWSPSTISHEAGHWVMASYGVSPREGGTHYLNTPESPGLAWSEGWATWHGAALQNDPLILSRRNGFMFWFDLAARRLSSNRAWARPSATGPLTQPIAENEVSAILWALAPAPRTAVHAALSSPRMTRSPFLRGYRNPQGTNVPYLADFLDALRCGGLPASAITPAVGPYPYDPARPLCQTAMDEAPPLTVDWRDEPALDASRTVGAQGVLRRVTAAVTAGITLDAPARLRFVAPPGARVVAGDVDFVIPRMRPGDRSEHAVTVAYASPPTEDLRLEAEVSLDDFGLRGAATWRFGRPAPATPPLPLGAPLRVNGVDLGPSVRAQ